LFTGIVFPLEELTAGRKPKFDAGSATGDDILLVEISPFIPAVVLIENVPTMTCVNPKQFHIVNCTRPCFI
jgi:hypothetical protein